jgi:hypothetical protein
MDFPIYKCHKEVQAFQIAHITAQAEGTHSDNIPEPRRVEVPREDGSVDYLICAQKTEYVLVDKTGDYVAVVDDDFMDRNKVHTGGYFVRYSNGHESFSPQDVFEDGYSQQELKRILHVKAGSEDWEPTIEDMQAILEMFMAAKDDPVGAVVVTNKWIDSTVEKVLRTDENEIVVVRATKQKKAAGKKAEPNWFDVCVRPADFKEGPEGHDGRTMWINNVQDSAYSVLGNAVRSIRLSGLTRAELHPELEAALEIASRTYEAAHGPIVWEEK